MAKVGFPSCEEKLAVARHSERYLFSFFSFARFLPSYVEPRSEKMNELVAFCQGQQGEL